MENKKALRYNYFIKQVVSNEIEISEKENTDENRRNVLLSLSHTRLMKLLYFTCLYSVTATSIGLFELFNNFVAYVNGPVEEDCYRNRSYLPDFRLNSNDKFEEGEDPYNCFSGELDDVEKDRIKDAVKKLYTQSNLNNDLGNTEKLIDISHQGYLWEKAKNTESKKMYVSDPINLDIERKKINICNYKTEVIC